jgi:hypothetical protein
VSDQQPRDGDLSGRGRGMQRRDFH